MDQPSLSEIRQEVKALIAADDARTSVLVHNDVYDAHLFAPEQVRFTIRQYRFLYAYKLGTPIGEAAAKAGLSIAACEAFLKKPATVAWLKDRAIKDQIRNEWAEPSKWWAEMDRYLHEDEVPKHKIEILKEFGDRVCPKVSRNADPSGSTKIEIHIDPQAVQDAFARQKQINAQIEQELHHEV